MKRFKLVILLRLREKDIQDINGISDLFFCSAETKVELLREVGNLGEDILFILDGFDELPKSLQQKGFLLRLIKGTVLPASTVLVTSRPSAIGELLTVCRPEINKYVEILGFTQKSIENYASSVFSSEPDTLKRFNAYISASDNPAINSLMYVPLNAAIIVEIFRSSRAGDILPHTLTQLYSQLCLTILNRHLTSNIMPRVDKVEDLAPDLHQNFLELCAVAFNGFVNEKVIFHDNLTGLVHFGFLDAVPSLYGGGAASYNFLHLTIQEFLSAYYISTLKSSKGLEKFRQYGKIQRWNVVWRFVAGLTQLKPYKGQIDQEVFVEKGIRGEKFSLFFFECLFEAETIEHFPSSLKTLSRTAIVQATDANSLDTYAIGFCIAHFSLGVPWSVTISNFGGHHSFSCGLNTSSTCVSTIDELGICTPFQIAELESNPLSAITGLCFRNNYFTYDDMIRLSQLIPKLVHLKELTIRDNRVTDDKDEAMLKILHQVHSSCSVTYLDIARSGVAEIFVVLPKECLSGLKQLIDPSTGKIEHLCIGDFSKEISNALITDLLSIPTTLKHLELRTEGILLNKLCLKQLVTLDFYLMTQELSSEIDDLINLVKHSKTLKVLCFRKFEISEQDIEKIKPLVAAIRKNDILQRVDIDNSSRNHDLDKSEFKRMIDMHQELRLDQRITWGRGLLVAEGIPHFGKLKLVDYYS